jgi:hypothetical protein
LSNSYVPPTIGSAESGNAGQNRRAQYEILEDDIMYPLETVVVVKGGGDDSTSEAGGRCGDSSSETAIVAAQPAIVQTKTATITYQSRK